jgi:hypothetical protein
MHLRFVVHELDEHSGRELGIFHAVGYLRNEGKLHGYEDIRHDLIRDWFNENLERPKRFNGVETSFLSKAE